MMPNNYGNVYEPNFESITVKVEHPEYGPMERSTTASQLNAMRLFDNEQESMSNFSPFKSEMYDDSVIDFIENSIDKFLVSCQKEKVSNAEKLKRGAERQRIYRKNESSAQRERRLELSRNYTKKRRSNESEEERFERLKKQRDRIRAIRQARKEDPETEKVRRKVEAERMKMRRASENPIQRMKRLEQSRMYSRRRRDNEVYRAIENEKNRLAHQFKRADISFRVQERQRDRLRKKIKRQVSVESQDSAMEDQDQL